LSIGNDLDLGLGRVPRPDPFEITALILAKRPPWSRGLNITEMILEQLHTKTSITKINKFRLGDETLKEMMIADRLGT